MSFPRYPRYKPSGVDWLAEVPEHWRVCRLRQLTDLNPSKQELAEVPLTTLATFLPMEAIGEDGKLDCSCDRPLRDLLTGYTYFRDGDVAIAKITPCFENGKGAVMRELTNGIGFGTTELIVARPHAGQLEAKFLHYLFASAPFRDLGESWMYGAGGQKRVPEAFVAGFTTGLPEFEEQRVIATFLDRETAKIDALIAEQERLIELLREKRQAVISHAVTKGLNPNAPMKPSGVEWLGDVPAHWGIRKLKFLADIQTGARDTEDAIDDGRYAFFVRSQDIERIDSVAFDCEAILTAGDGAGVGKVFHYFRGPFDFHQRVYMMNDFRLVSGRFLYFYFAEQFSKVALDGGAKSTVDSLRRPMLTNFPVCVPPASEQSAIVAFADQCDSRFEGLISASRHAINLFQERRAALISAAVTGQIDVRNFVAEAA